MTTHLRASAFVALLATAGTAHAEPDVAPTAASPQDVSGRIELADAAGTPTPAGAVIFLSARADGAAKGPPTWVLRMAASPLPTDFRIGPANAMMGGPTPDKVRVTARLDADGNASTRGPDDLEATSDLVAPGASGIVLRLAAPTATAETAPATGSEGAGGGVTGGAQPPPSQASEVPEGVVTGVDPTSVVGPPLGAPVEGEALRARTMEAARLLRCVVCQGMSVADSPSETARAMRDQVEGLAAKGYETQQILDWFEASYGAFVLLEPKQEGLNWLVWAAPGGLLALGAAWIVSRTRGAGAGVQPSGDDDPLAPWLARVRAETRPSATESKESES